VILAVNFLQLMPGFVSGAHDLHNILVGVTFGLSVAGLLLLANQGFREQSVKGILPALVRLTVVVILVWSLGGFGNLLMTAVDDIISQMGLNSASGGIFEAYRAAVAQKFGSDGAGQPSAAKQAPQQNTPSPSMPLTEGDTSGGFTSGRQLGGALAGHEQAFAAAGAQYGVDPKFLEAIAIEETGNGTSNALRTYNNPAGLMDPSTPNDTGFQSFSSIDEGINAEASLLQRNYLSQGLTTIDQIGAVYAPAGAANDPNGTNGNWGSEVSSIYQELGGTGDLLGPANGGGNNFLGGWISKIGDSLTVGLLFPLVHLLSLIALGIMWLMQAVQQIAYTIEVAVSPIFLGFLMVPRLVGTATKFLCSQASITLWGLGWAVADLLTRALIAFAVNPTNNLAQTPFSASSMMLGYWVVLALWVHCGSSVHPSSRP